MSEQPESLTLILLRRMDERLLRLDQRLESIEFETRQNRKPMALLQGDIAHLHESVARVEVRLDRIERRLDMTEHAT
jgi:septal ring factor EnvC (AmiA/AmiB activator)